MRKSFEQRAHNDGDGEGYLKNVVGLGVVFIIIAAVLMWRNILESLN